MDFITHALMGAGVARLLSPRREWIPQLSLAAVLGSQLQDADPWLYLIHPSMYGKYHRVATHNLWALALVGIVSATIAWAINRVQPWRRFGWFVSDNLPRSSFPDPIRHAPLRWGLAVAIPSAYLHFLGDVITGFGNILPFWPFSSYDASLHAVTSFDWVIFSSTLAWHVILRQERFSQKGNWTITGLYGLLVTGYVVARLIWGSSTVW